MANKVATLNGRNFTTTIEIARERGILHGKVSRLVSKGIALPNVFVDQAQVFILEIREKRLPGESIYNPPPDEIKQLIQMVREFYQMQDEQK